LQEGSELFAETIASKAITREIFRSILRTFVNKNMQEDENKSSNNKELSSIAPFSHKRRTLSPSFFFLFFSFTTTKETGQQMKAMLYP
jgi:hypothetical protein